MSPGLLVGLEMALVLGVVIGLAAWELWRLRREVRRPPAPEPAAPGPATPSPPAAPDH